MDHYQDFIQVRITSSKNAGRCERIKKSKTKERGLRITVLGGELERKLRDIGELCRGGKLDYRLLEIHALRGVEKLKIVVPKSAICYCRRPVSIDIWADDFCRLHLASTINGHDIWGWVPQHASPDEMRRAKCSCAREHAVKIYSGYRHFRLSKDPTESRGEGVPRPAAAPNNSSVPDLSDGSSLYSAGTLEAPTPDNMSYFGPRIPQPVGADGFDGYDGYETDDQKPSHSFN